MLLNISIPITFTIRRVCVRGSDVAMLTIYLADVLCQIPAIGIPCAVLLDGKRTSSYRLRRIPGEEPQAGMITASEVAACNLQVASVQIALVQLSAARLPVAQLCLRHRVRFGDRLHIALWNDTPGFE